MFSCSPLRLLGAALLVASLVSANIYPTTPYSSTVFNAGRMNTVEWMDDGMNPSVQDMGPLKIDLYSSETYITTLDELVDPTRLSQAVWISPSWMHNGSDYHMRFICEDPPLTVYTADFTITGMTDLTPFGGPYVDDHNNTDPNVVYVTPMLTLVLPDTTIVSALKPTPSTVSPKATAPPESTLEDEGFNSRMRGQVQSGAAAASIRKRPTVNLEYLKFRSVFVFWPSLIGIAMAL
ncbi:hypothetical protein OH76DRAFT_1397729 [Lentinus brumalis]|uniref:Yeast cell wall synthesis Kre9/Knh1-like N-terminal domain-containing protein n=1 Tax=Lentinus brumalis TaxID=2498619 RepID=A0A371DPK4_9APHY|nr:hypothetical protein OH76DRAFT_1397729 [Polyporus brumalis]